MEVTKLTASKVRLIAILIVVGVAIIFGLTGFYEVKQGEQAVILTFGQITETKEAGLYWRMPLIQEVRLQSRTVIYTIEYGFRTTQSATTTSQAQYQDMDDEAIILTGDQNIVRVEAVYQVIVQDVSSFLYRVDDPFGTMQCAFESVLRRNLQNRTLDDALLNKQDIEVQALQDFREMLKPYNLGVQVKEVRIQNINVPEEVKAAYEDVNNAKNEKTRKLDEAEQYYNKVVPSARAQAYTLEQSAQAYSARTVANANGEVAQFNDVYAKYIDNKEITRKRLLIETLESILANADKLYMVDDNSGVLKLLGLGGDTSSSGLSAITTPQPTEQAGGN
jgi:modulator of FtsH protease HflK